MTSFLNGPLDDYKMQYDIDSVPAGEIRATDVPTLIFLTFLQTKSG